MVSTTRPIATFADHRKGVMADLAVGPQVVGSDQVTGIDLLALDELVDFDGARRLRRKLFQLRTPPRLRSKVPEAGP